MARKSLADLLDSAPPAAREQYERDMEVEGRPVALARLREAVKAKDKRDKQVAKEATKLSRRLLGTLNAVKLRVDPELWDEVYALGLGELFCGELAEDAEDAENAEDAEDAEDAEAEDAEAEDAEAEDAEAEDAGDTFQDTDDGEEDLPDEFTF